MFFNRVLDRYKILVWDRDGLILVYKRLEQGCFQRVPHDGSQGLAIEVDATTLTLIFSGATNGDTDDWRVVCNPPENKQCPRVGTLAGP